MTRNYKMSQIEVRPGLFVATWKRQPVAKNRTGGIFPAWFRERLAK
jgi:hypothetical protein